MKYVVEMTPVEIPANEQKHKRHRFKEPTSREDALARRTQLVIDCREIDAQLADKDRKSADGERLTGVAYHQWRSGAVYVLARKRNEMVQIDAWLKAHPAEQPRLEARSKDIRRICKALGHFLGDSGRDEIEARFGRIPDFVWAGIEDSRSLLAAKCAGEQTA